MGTMWGMYNVQLSMWSYGLIRGKEMLFVCMQGMLNYIELSGLQGGNDEGGMLNYKELCGLQLGK